jgi:hypothetical protein
MRRQWHQQTVLEGILLAGAGVLAVLVAVIAADNWLKLEALGRSLLALVLWGTLAATVIGLVIRRWLQDRREDYFAALVERKHPELHNLLINALQLGRGPQNGCSPRLIEAIVNDAVQATGDLEMATSLDSRPIKRAAIGAGLALLVTILYAGLLPAWFQNGLARILLPVADIAPYTATRVAVKHDKDRVAEGDKVVVEARISGLTPREASLFRRRGDRWTEAMMQRDEASEDVFRFTVSQAAESFDYYVQAGDGRSPHYRIEVVKRPQVAKLALTYAWPAYTELPPYTAEASDGEIRGIAGTTVALELKATKPLQEAWLVTKQSEIKLQPATDDPSIWRGAFVLWSKDAKPSKQRDGQVHIEAPTQYQVKLKDTEGYENADPLWRPITLARDHPPTVLIASPGRDLQAAPDATVSLTVEAHDDYGLDEVVLWYRVNDEPTERELKRFRHEEKAQLKTGDSLAWDLSQLRLKGGTLVQYWATATDRNDIAREKGRAESRRYTLFLAAPEETTARLDQSIQDYAAVLKELARLQRVNKDETRSGLAFPPLVARQTLIRNKTRELARAMEKDVLPVAPIVRALDTLFTGLMAQAVRLFEMGRDSSEPARAADLRGQSLPVQDKIIAELEALVDRLDRLLRNEKAREALRKIERTDKESHQKIAAVLNQMIKDLDKLLKDQKEIAGKFEKMPKKTDEELKEERMKGLKELEDIQKRWDQWAKGTVAELAKLPTGFEDDFSLKADVNKVFEEIEKAASRAKAEKVEVSLEDMGVGLATRMKEDLETWMSDAPDATKWVMEEPLDKKTPKVPEMPLPKALEDLVGDLLQKAEEFDEEADDVTSAWGDNLDQAGWGVSDGPIATFSAKGKTGNDQPNNNEMTGRSGDGRRGKSSGQMVGDTARGLQGRKTPARVGNERYEPGQLKQEGSEDPDGATGGGKKAGAGKKGLQGGSPPDFTPDMGRLSEKQALLREQAEQIAKKLDTVGITSGRLKESIRLMKQVENDLRDKRYEDAARKRRVALSQLRSSVIEMDQASGLDSSRARNLPAQLRTELLQAAEEGCPAGYESLLKSYYKALSTAEK